MAQAVTTALIGCGGRRVDALGRGAQSLDSLVLLAVCALSSITDTYPRAFATDVLADQEPQRR